MSRIVGAEAEHRAQTGIDGHEQRQEQNGQAGQVHGRQPADDATSDSEDSKPIPVRGPTAYVVHSRCNSRAAGRGAPFSTSAGGDPWTSPEGRIRCRQCPIFEARTPEWAVLSGVQAAGRPPRPRRRQERNRRGPRAGLSALGVRPLGQACPGLPDEGARRADVRGAGGASAASPQESHSAGASAISYKNRPLSRSTSDEAPVHRCGERPTLGDPPLPSPTSDRSSLFMWKDRPLSPRAQRDVQLRVDSSRAHGEAALRQPTHLEGLGRGRRDDQTKARHRTHAGRRLARPAEPTLRGQDGCGSAAALRKHVGPVLSAETGIRQINDGPALEKRMGSSAGQTLSLPSLWQQR